jgi:excisionase family DNA binding protein
MQSKAKRFYTTFEAAKICQVSPGSINRWIHEGKIKAGFTGGGHHRIEAGELGSFLDQLNLPRPEDLLPGPFKCLFLSENKAFVKQLTQTLLAPYPELIAEEAHDYFMAGWKASRFRPDLVVLDLGSCGARALKICELMRAFFEYRETPFLVLTSEMTPDLKKKIQQLGASDWLLKPFVKSDFLKKIDGLMNAGRYKMTGS